MVKCAKNKFKWERNSRLSKEKKRYSKAIKEVGCCILCGEDNAKKLTFHHRPGTKKRFNVGFAYKINVSMDELKEEIQKCDLVCSRCHSELHNGNGDGKEKA